MIEEITVGQYQELYAIQKSDLDELDKITESVSVLSGKTIRELDEMPVIEFNKLSQKLTEALSREIPKTNPKKFIECEKSVYGICYEPSKLNRGQYVTALHFMGGDIISNCHLIIASITYNPKTKKHESENHALIAEDIKSAKFIDVYAACVFFCNLLKNSIYSLRGYLEKEASRKGVNKEKVQKVLTDLFSQESCRF
jgi:hypothetical protein